MSQGHEIPVNSGPLTRRYERYFGTKTFRPDPIKSFTIEPKARPWRCTPRTRDNLLELGSLFCYNDVSEMRDTTFQQLQKSVVGRAWQMRQSGGDDMKSTGVVRRSSFARVLFAMSLRFVTIMVSGCATANVDHADKAAVMFERMPSEDVVVSQVRAVKDGDGLLIYGKVKRTAGNCCDSARGHVDIAVVGPDGATVDMLSVPYSPRNIPKARSRSSRFAARLPYSVPEDVPLRITYHKDREHAASTVDPTDNLLCKHNLTTPDSEG